MRLYLIFFILFYYQHSFAQALMHKVWQVHLLHQYSGTRLKDDWSKLFKNYHSGLAISLTRKLTPRWAISTSYNSTSNDKTYTFYPGNRFFTLPSPVNTELKVASKLKVKNWSLDLEHHIFPLPDFALYGSFGVGFLKARPLFRAPTTVGQIDNMINSVTARSRMLIRGSAGLQILVFNYLGFHGAVHWIRTRTLRLDYISETTLNAPRQAFKDSPGYVVGFFAAW